MYPINSGGTRLALLAAAGLTLIVTLWLAWPYRWCRWVVLALVAFPMVWLCVIPAGGVERGALRTSYIGALHSYLDTPYVWGGENHRGIDCSGLVRRGFRDALSAAAVRQVDAGLLRQAIVIWWKDCSAQELGRGYGGRCRRVASAPSLNGLDHAALLPGDMAVTADGVHVLAYVGERRWISADPVAEKVTLDVAGLSTNDYLAVPVEIMRWRLMEVSND